MKMRYLKISVTSSWPSRLWKGGCVLCRFLIFIGFPKVGIPISAKLIRGAQLIKLRSWHRQCKTYFPEMAGGNVWFNKRQNRSLPLDANAPPGQTSDAACLQLLRKLTKAVRPDLVVLTGDILDGRVSSFVLREFRFSCCQ